MDVDDLDRGIVLEVLAELGDVYVHRAGVEVVVVDPDGLEGVVAFEDLVDMRAQEAEQFRLLGGELGDLVADEEHLLLGVEGELAYLVHGNLLALLALDAAQDSLDTEYELFHRERLGDIVVGADLEAFEDIVLERFCGEEDDRYFGVDGTDFLSEGKTVFLGHHHVENADVVLSFEESLVSGFTVDKEVGVAAFGLEILAKEHAEVFVVFAEKNFDSFFHSR